MSFWFRGLLTLIAFSTFPVRADELPPSLPALPTQNPAMVKSHLLPEHETSLYLNLGGTVNADNYYSVPEWNPGFDGGVGLGVNASRLLSIILDAQFHYFPRNPNFKGTDGTLTGGGDFSHFIVMPNLKFRFILDDNPVVPYALFGMGCDFYNVGALSETSPPPNSITSTTLPGSGAVFTIRLVLGMDVRLDAKNTLFFQYGFHGMPLAGLGGLEYDGVNGFAWIMANAGLKMNL